MISFITYTWSTISTGKPIINLEENILKKS